MSTRAIVGTPNGPDPTGSYRGVYVHSDGNPRSLGRTLHLMCRTHFARHGEQLAVYMIDQHPEGWSAVGGNAAGPSKWRDILSLPKDEATIANISYQGRPGVQNNGLLDERSDFGQQWTYLITDSDLIVVHGDTQNGDVVARVPFSRDTDVVDWEAIEFGHQLERSTCRTWVHFPEIDGPAREMSVDEFLGRSPMLPESAAAFHVNDTEWKATGSRMMQHNSNGDLDLTITLVDPDGVRRSVVVGSINPCTREIVAWTKNVSPIYPPTYEEHYGRPFSSINEHRQMTAAT